MLNLFNKKESGQEKNLESGAAKTNEAKGRKLQGVVVSDKMKKTVVVAISNLKLHSKYKKYFNVTKRFKAHDENNEYKVGDKVVIQETKPMSKEKRWMVVGKV